MASVSIIVEGLDDLSKRFKDSPNKFKVALGKAMEAALLVIWESVPSYPRKPEGSTYRRTGTLGRTLGSTEFGGVGSNPPDIYSVHEEGGYTVGEFGSNLEYAPYVIGDEEQAWMHKGRWWVLGTVLEKAKDKIQRVFEIAAEEMARWLESKGL
jgi:hypothetical protein